jgi:hypothetical protein
LAKRCQFIPRLTVKVFLNPLRVAAAISDSPDDDLVLVDGIIDGVREYPAKGVVIVFVNNAVYATS